MKLYIPTSSLNLGNILSTESISPKSFYRDRNFGSKYWYSVEENNYENIILLYEEPHTFTRPESDLEDHPMLIEVECSEGFPIAQDGVRYSDHTVYLHPWKTHIIFFSETDKSAALTLCMYSAEVKVLELYRRKITVGSYYGTFPAFKEGYDIPQNKEELHRDERINGVKGALYGYYIGAYLSVSSENLVLLNGYREIRNIVSSIISGREGKPSPNQEIRLREIFNRFRQATPLYQEILQIIGNKDLLESVLAILKNHGKVIFPDEIGDLFQLMRDFPEDAVKSVQQKIERLERNESTKRRLLAVEKSEILTADGETLLLSPDICENEIEKKLFEAWMNECFIPHESLKRITSKKEELVKELIGIAQVCVGEDAWPSSQIQRFMENLQQHVVGAEYKEPWHNDVLSSVAIVVTKGDEWTTLLSNMQKREMTDYRFAFAFYGALLGFSNLTRDFTDLIIDINEKRGYVIEIYKEFHGQLHGDTINTDKKEDAGKENIQTTFPKVVYVEGQNNSEVQGIVEKIESHNGYKKTKFSGYIEQIKEKQLVDKDSIRGLSGSKSDGWKSFIDKVLGKAGMNRKKREIEQSVQTLNLFDETNEYGKRLICDHIELVVSEINGSNISDELKKKVIKNIQEFLEKYQPGGFYYKNSNRYRRINSEIISHWEKWCFSPKNGHTRIDEFDRRAIKEICERLLKIFP